MSARVHELLDEIREKSIKLKDQVATERAKNATLTAEVSELKAEMSGKSQEVENLKGKVSELTDNIESMKEQRVNTTSETKATLSNEEIDALVKEIEYCIKQLKK